MILLKREIAKKMGHRKTQIFLKATMYGARLVPIHDPVSLTSHFLCYFTLNIEH